MDNTSLGFFDDLFHEDVSEAPQPAPCFPLPEAPCSINAFIELPTIGRTQITGRGCTGEEAATNFQATQKALAARYAQPTLTLGHLFDLWHRKYAGHMWILKTGTDALLLCAQNMVNPADTGGYIVNDGEGIYTVTLEPNICTPFIGACPVCHQTADDIIPCLHIIAARMYRATTEG